MTPEDRENLIKEFDKLLESCEELDFYHLTRAMYDIEYTWNYETLSVWLDHALELYKQDKISKDNLMEVIRIQFRYN